MSEAYCPTEWGIEAKPRGPQCPLTNHLCTRIEGHPGAHTCYCGAAMTPSESAPSDTR